MSKQDKINKFLKRLYEHVIIDCICDDLEVSFMYEEMADSRFVNTIYITVYRDSNHSFFYLYTEDYSHAMGSPGNLDVEGVFLTELVEFLDEMNINYSSPTGDDSVEVLRADFPVREWYDSYMVPLIKTGIEARRL